MLQEITVTLDEVKDHLNLKGVSTFDTLLSGYIIAATSKARIDCSQNYSQILANEDKSNVLKQCILIKVGDFYEERTSTTDMSNTSSTAYDYLIETVRLTNSC